MIRAVEVARRTREVTYGTAFLAFRWHKEVNKPSLAFGIGFYHSHAVSLTSQ